MKAVAAECDSVKLGEGAIFGVGFLATQNSLLYNREKQVSS